MNKLTYSNVMASIAVFVALGGSSYAAVTLKNNSVRGKHIAPNAVTSPKVKDGSLLRSDFAANQLPAGSQGPQGPEGTRGPEGLAGQKGDRGEPGPLINPELFHDVGASGEPPFGNGAEGDCVWKNYDSTTFNAAGFFKDPWGMVHLKGLVDADDSLAGDGDCDFDTLFSSDLEIFQLPAGYRPRKREVFVTLANNKLSRIDVRPDGVVKLEGGMTDPFSAETWLALDGMTFRAQ